jgi:hypothetical protein
MSEAFRLGGWGMYPTAVSGLILIVCAWRFAMSPQRARLGLVKWLYALTGLTGALGFVAGMIKTLIAAGQLPPDEAVRIAMIGLGESANNLGLVVGTMVVATIGVALGHRKPAPGGALVDPLP